jgi:uncharacterized protein
MTSSHRHNGYPVSGPQGRRLAVHRDQVLEIAARYGATNVRVFGSVARGEDTISSDIDLLVDIPARQAVLLSVAGLIEELRDLLGVSVHVATAEMLRDEIRDGVLATAAPL